MEQGTTNQHLVARPCHVNVHSAGSQCELRPQLVNQLVRGHPIATLQSERTPWQGLVTWHPGLQNHPQSDPQQKDFPDRE